MKKHSILIVLLIFSCSIEQKNFELNGKIDGLNSEKIYLLESNSIILDSTKIDDSSSFTLKCYIEEPQILTLRLGDSDTDQVKFFAETGAMTLSTTSKRFQFDAQFSGSKQQSNLDEFNSYLIKFEEEDIELLEIQIEESMKSNQKNIDSISILRDKADNQVQIVLLEAAILVFAGWQDIVDEIWLVQTPRELVENRLSNIGKFNSKDIQNRINTQMHYFDNKEFADIIIDNSSTKQSLELKINKLWEERILKRKNYEVK